VTRAVAGGQSPAHAGAAVPAIRTAAPMTAAPARKAAVLAIDWRAATMALRVSIRSRTRYSPLSDAC
jgi:hypothetical protein